MRVLDRYELLYELRPGRRGRGRRAGRAGPRPGRAAGARPPPHSGRRPGAAPGQVGLSASGFRGAAGNLHPFPAPAGGRGPRRAGAPQAELPPPGGFRQPRGADGGVGPAHGRPAGRAVPVSPGGAAGAARARSGPAPPRRAVSQPPLRHPVARDRTNCLCFAVQPPDDAIVGDMLIQSISRRTHRRAGRRSRPRRRRRLDSFDDWARRCAGWPRPATPSSWPTITRSPGSRTSPTTWATPWPCPAWRLAATPRSSSSAGSTSWPRRRSSWRPNDRTAARPARRVFPGRHRDRRPTSAKWRQEHPGGLVVAYVNTSAAVKAESDICCTSSNAVEVVASRCPPTRQVLFLPDMFLGQHVARKTGRHNLDIWMGECHVHAAISPVDLRAKVAQHPRSELFIHPECGCTTSALWLAESGEFPKAERTHVLSTAGMVNAARALGDGHALVATETGILHQLRDANPRATFEAVSPRAECRFMKMTTPQRLLDCLRDGVHVVEVDEGVGRARPPGRRRG